MYSFAPSETASFYEESDGWYSFQAHTAGSRRRDTALMWTQQEITFVKMQSSLVLMQTSEQLETILFTADIPRNGNVGKIVSLRRSFKERRNKHDPDWFSPVEPWGLEKASP
mmetsp:Transcript_5515/g.12696  ORF Transcript_5515/g.12696 Transcript_5515/m.12696 type:complete len:112 (-) Transcript_5515:1338-1673(-)